MMAPSPFPEVAVRTLSVLAGVLAVLVLGAGGASAEPPPRLDDRVTDRAGVLGSGGAGQVAAAIERLRAETGTDLFVVFVDSFDGAAGQDWADQTAVRSQLGDEDLLLAVAVGDRAYGLSIAEGFPISESTVDEVRTRQVEPRLAAGDWAGAAVAMADGLRTGGGGGGALVGLLVVGGVAVVGGGAYVLTRRRRARTPAPAEEAPDGEPTSDLAYRASTALIEVDDAVRTSEQELAAARAHFGAEAVAGFATALEQSRAEMLQAFALRQRLDDDEPEDERAQRELHSEIIRLARAADDRLDEQVEAFDALRALEARAPEYVAGLRTRRDAVSARLPQVEQVWTALQERYAATALEPVDDDLDQARALLAAAEAEIAEARQALAMAGASVHPGGPDRHRTDPADGGGATGAAGGPPGGSTAGTSAVGGSAVGGSTAGTSAVGGSAVGGSAVGGSAAGGSWAVGSGTGSDATGAPGGGAGPAGSSAAAVVAGRAAEDAVTQAETLLDGILRRESELAEAAERVPAARAEVELDLAEARALPDDALAPVVARAAAALAAADEAAAAPRPDPLAALRLLDEAGTALDRGIADARETAERARRAAAALEQAVLTARSSVAAAEDFVVTRRGAVGAPARTRIAEARRHLEQAGGPDPVAALQHAQQADALAREALRLARSDVAQWERPTVITGSGSDLGSLILGGILSGARSGGYRSRSRGGFGGGGFSSGSFGGSSRRGRRGGGGRF